MSELRRKIRDAIVAWDHGSAQGARFGEFAFLLSERSRDQLAEAIETALLARWPGLPEFCTYGGDDPQEAST